MVDGDGWLWALLVGIVVVGLGLQAAVAAGNREAEDLARPRAD
jgi:hypothetical protein